MKILQTIVLAMLFTILACASVDALDSVDTPLEQQTLAQQRAQAIAEFDHKGCEDSGGSMQIAGLLGFPLCVVAFEDAGKQCQSERDCEGRCMIDNSVTDFSAAKSEAVGLCEANSNPFGCYGEVIDGTPGAMICVD